MITHKLSWKRNGAPRRICNGKAIQYVGCTKAKAACSCGWEGSWFPTRDIEFYTIIGEREFVAHA